MKPAPSRTNIIALHRVDIASPCTASWASMKGDERVRHCGDCNKNVFNLSAMPEAEAAALLADNVDGALCVRFYRRPDGTIMTSDCGTSTRAATRRALRTLPAVAGAALIAMSVGASAAPGREPPAKPAQNPEPVLMMGAPLAVQVEAPPKAPPVTPVMMGKPSVASLHGKDDKQPASTEPAPRRP